MTINSTDEDTNPVSIEIQKEKEKAFPEPKIVPISNNMNEDTSDFCLDIDQFEKLLSIRKLLSKILICLCLLWALLELSFNDLRSTYDTHALFSLVKDITIVLIGIIAPVLLYTKLYHLNTYEDLTK